VWTNDSAPQYAVQPDSTDPTKINIYAIDFNNGPNDPYFATGYVPLTATPVTVNSYLSPGGGALPQPPASASPPVNVSFAGSRFWNSVYRRGSIWTCHMVKGAPSGGQANRIVIRWYEILTNGFGTPSGGQPSLRQQGEIDPATLFNPVETAGMSAYVPAIFVDDSGNAAVTYNVVGPQSIGPNGLPQYISIWRSSRCVTDPLNTMPTTNIQRQGTSIVGTINTVGFGDYSGICADPAVANRFWYHVGQAVAQDTDPQQGRSHAGYFDVGCGFDPSGDGMNDTADAAMFFQSFGVGEPEADIVLDGSIDSSDAAAYPDFAAPKP